MPEYPLPFLQEIREILGDEYSAFLEAMQKEPEKVLRVNPLRAFVAPEGDSVPWEPCGIYVKGELHPGRDIAHIAGAYYMQDASAMAPVAALMVQKGERVIDLCAAPGGKSGQIAQRLAGTGTLVSNEIDKKRAKMLAGNLERLGVANAIVTSTSVDKLADAWEGLFDAVLTDAPCSGEGMFRKDPDALQEWTEGSPEGCHNRQMFILRHAARLARKGGRIVYSTCTFNRRENEDTIREFLEAHADFEAEEFSLPGLGESHGGMLRLWPQRIRGEGHFVAKLRRKGNDSLQESVYKPDKAALAAYETLRRELAGYALSSEEQRRLRLIGDQLTLLPEADLPCAGIPVLRQGLQLCRVAKGYIEPDHAFAMALPPETDIPVFACDDRQAVKFLAGETFEAAGKSGWTLVCRHGLPLGWGKNVQGIMKNHLPKGLRIHVEI